MRCHYEVLEVPQDADDHQIKTSYRKLALKWHPDKNLDNSEAAKVEFQLVQQAYEVLSDRNERAWYDNHREQILRGKNSEFKDNSVDVFQYFTTTCFKGYNDDEEGFYSVYRNVFEEISREDIEFMEEKEELTEIPPFGTSSSDYDDIVGPFYAYWTSYTTKKSFVWLDPYSSNETRDRKIFKLMEKENKKVRLKAKKERNEEVRALVAFVRKRDKRVQEYSKKMEAKILENRQKQEKLSKQRRLERKKQLNESNSQAEWTKFDNVKTELEEIEKRLAEQFGEQISDSENDEDDSIELDNLYCVACNKVFKTPKAFENHELSKKHRENVEKLKDCMVEEEEGLDELEDLAEDATTAISNGVHSDEEVSNTEQSEDQQETKRKKKQKKSKNVIQVNLSDNEDVFLLTKQTVDDKNTNDSNNFGISKKQKRKNKKGASKLDTPANTTNTNEGLQNEQIAEDAEENAKCSTKIKKNKKSKEKRDRDKEEVETQQPDVDTNHCCVTCKADFASKNKLFDHLKKTGHSVYLQQNVNLKNKRKLVKEK